MSNSLIICSSQFNQSLCLSFSYSLSVNNFNLHGCSKISNVCGLALIPLNHSFMTPFLQQQTAKHNTDLQSASSWNWYTGLYQSGNISTTYSTHMHINLQWQSSQTKKTINNKWPDPPPSLWSGKITVN